MKNLSNTTGSHGLKRIEFLTVTQNEKVVSVSKDVAEFFLFRSEIAPTLEKVRLETRSTSFPLMLLTSVENGASISEFLPQIQKLHQSFPRSQIVLVTEGGETAENRMRLKDVGAEHLISFDELHSSSKIFYLASMLVRGTYLPAPVTDFFPNTEIPFNLYQKLPLNQKYLPVVLAKFTLSDKKYRRLETRKEVHVHRRDFTAYREYIEKYHDRTGNALKKRCRATLLGLMKTYSELMLSLTLDSKGEQGEIRQHLLDEYYNAFSELMEYLKDCPDVWNVIAQAVDFQFAHLDRGIAILAYAAYIAQKLEFENLQDIAKLVMMTGAGFLSLPSDTYKALQHRGPQGLSPQDLEIYFHHHPRPEDPLPMEATLVQFCELMDRRLRAELQEGLKTHDLIRQQAWDEEKLSLERFSAEFLDKIEKVLIA